MDDKRQGMLGALRDLAQTTDVLIRSLERQDLEKAHEAISVLLMQGMDYFGPASALMQQCFPVWDAVRSHIDRGDAALALGQSQVWSRQLDEVIAIVEQG